MKRIAVLSVSFPQKTKGKWTRLVERYCPAAKWTAALTQRGQLSACCRFDTSDPQYSEFLAALEECGGLRYPHVGEGPEWQEQFDTVLRAQTVKWSERWEHVYTVAELRGFPLLDLRVDRKPLEAGGPEYGTTYDLSTGCAKCGTGATQTSALMLPLAGLPKTGVLCEAAHDEKLVAGKLADALRDRGVSGLELRRVRFHRNNEPLPWWQVISTHEMPRMSASTRGVIRSETLPPCTYCQRDGHYDASVYPTEIAYDRSEVAPAALPDVVHTWERFGKAGIHEDFRFSRFAPPLLLVKPTVFDLFRQLRVRGARFEPVRFV